MKYEDKLEYFKEALNLYLPSIVSNYTYEIVEENDKLPDDDGTLSLKLPLEEIQKQVVVFHIKNMTEYELYVLQVIIASMGLFFKKDLDELFFMGNVKRSIQFAIANIMSEKSPARSFFLLDLFQKWSSETYEGNRISSSIGCVNSDNGAISLHPNFFDEDFLKVLTSGRDTILVFDGNLVPVGYEPLSENEDDSQLFSPVSFIPIASWSKNNDFAISLNRNGEILCFKNGSLAFAHRRGLWIGFSHEAYIKGMSEDGGCDSDLCRALYLTMLDVSFRRTGGCLGVLSSGRKEEYATLIAEQDRFTENPRSDKSRFLKTILKEYKRFQDIPRKLRQELVGIDGATIVDERGELLCVGAIIEIPGGSTGGGGRTAAAKAIAKYGLGIKISNDGKIQYWKKTEPGDEEPAYTIG